MRRSDRVLLRAAKKQMLRRSECARRLGLHPDSWDAYWRDHEDLILGRRTIGKQNRWPKDVIERHLERCA